MVKKEMLNRVFITFFKLIQLDSSAVKIFLT